MKFIDKHIGIIQKLIAIGFLVFLFFFIFTVKTKAAEIVEIIEVVQIIGVIMEEYGDDANENMQMLLEAVEIQNEIIASQFALMYVLLGTFGIWFAIWICNQIWRLIWYHLIQSWI